MCGHIWSCQGPPGDGVSQETPVDQEQCGLSQIGRAGPRSQSHPTTPGRNRAAWGQLGTAPALGISHLPGDRMGCHLWPQCPHSAVWKPLPTVSRRMLVLSPSSPTFKRADALRTLTAVSRFAPVCQYKRSMVSLEQVQQRTSRVVRGVKYPI